jgi:hypothetical protein
MATAYTSAYEMKSVSFQGVINEDVMQELFNISPVDVPFIDMAGREASSNPYKSWVTESLAAPSLTNARVEGADAGAAGALTQSRIGNHHQISDKVATVSDRSNSVDTIGYANRLAHELMVKQKELKRDMEAILLSNQASVEMVTTTGSEVAGKTAGAPAMIADANSQRATTGSFSNGIFAAVASITASAGLTEKMIRDAADAAYNAGGEPTMLMSTPAMIRGISEYLFTASARIATLMSDSPVKQGKYGKQGTTAIGAVQVFTTDFSTLELVPNRMQQTYDNAGTANVNVYLFDPQFWAVSYLQGIMAKPLARTGTAESRQITVDYTLLCKAPTASAVICGINPATAVVAG